MNRHTLKAVFVAATVARLVVVGVLGELLELGAQPFPARLRAKEVRLAVVRASGPEVLGDRIAGVLAAHELDAADGPDLLAGELNDGVLLEARDGAEVGEERRFSAHQPLAHRDHEERSEQHDAGAEHEEAHQILRAPLVFATRHVSRPP